VNTSFIDNNLCGDQNCSPVIIKNPGWYYIDGLGFYIKEGIHFSDYTYGEYSFNFSEDAILFLKQACDPDISSVLNFLNENTLTEIYYDFYPYHPTSSYGNITQINENWWLRSASRDFSTTNSQFWLKPGSIIFLLVLILLTIIGIIFGIKFRKEKKKNQLIILICMIILAIIFSILLFIIYYISSMI
jgi:hypothetical protein